MSPKGFRKIIKRRQTKMLDSELSKGTAEIEKNVHGFSLTITSVVLIVVSFSLGYYLFKSGLIAKWFNSFKTDSNFSTFSPIPTPTPRRIPHGKIGFTIGQADKTVPQFGKGSIDPYDPSKGGKQTISVEIKHSSPIKKVTAQIKTDSSVSEAYEFELISGTKMDGVWQGTWTVEDTYLYSYGLVLKAESNTVALSEFVLR